MAAVQPESLSTAISSQSAILATRSIQSFDVTHGIPTPNNDLQNSVGFAGPATGLNSPLGNVPNGVDITQDGRWVIFGDTSTLSLVEV